MDEFEVRIDVVVSRHHAACLFIASQLGGTYRPKGRGEACISVPDGSGGERLIPVLASASAEDVRGKVVAGNLPLNLCVIAHTVYAVEFLGDAPRGAEYTLEDMRAASAHLVPYTVLCGRRDVLNEELAEQAFNDGCQPAFVMRWL